MELDSLQNYKYHIFRIQICVLNFYNSFFIPEASKSVMIFAK